jgi:hypothetical protein
MIFSNIKFIPSHMIFVYAVILAYFFMDFFSRNVYPFLDWEDHLLITIGTSFFFVISLALVFALGWTLQNRKLRRAKTRAKTKREEARQQLSEA